MTTVGTIELVATIDTSKYKQGADEIKNKNKEIEGSAETTSKRSNTAFNGIAKFGLAAVATAAVTAGAVIAKNIGNAVDRIDTLIAFPKVLNAMGVSMEDATSATEKLGERLLGLPTSLPFGAKATQELIAAGLSADKATEAFLGVNNALLAANSDAQDTQIVMDSLQRVISAGSGEATTMQAILSRMPTVLSALSKESGKSQGELYKLFAQDPQSLLDNIIRLNKEGGGGMASLDKQAREATGGIGTGFDNMNIAVTKGIEGIVKSIGGGDLEAGQAKIAGGITKIGDAFKTALGSVASFFEFIIRNQSVFAPIIVAMSTITGLLTAWFVATKVLAAGQAVLNAVMAANPIGLIIIAIAGLIAAILYLWKNVDGFRNFFIKAFGAIKSTVSDFWSWLGRTARSAWGSVVNAFSGVVGFFRGIWNNITGWFKRIGASFGNSIAGAFKGAVNAMLGFMERRINDIVGVMNEAIHQIDNITPGGLGRISGVSLPRLAEGGIVTRPTIAMVGEGRESEAVIPLSKLDKMLDNDSSRGNTIIEIGNIHIAKEVDADRFFERLTKEQEIISKGMTPGAFNV